AKELQVTAREAGKTGRETPEKNADRDRLRTGAAVAEPPEDRRGEQIDDQKAAHQAPELGIREPHRSLLEVRQQRRDDIAVEVVEEVDAGENGECEQREPARPTPGLIPLFAHAGRRRSARADLQPLEMLAYRIAEAFAARHRGATREHQDEIAPWRAADLPYMIDVHQAGAADSQHGLGL